jgi:hypothetical protein
MTHTFSIPLGFYLALWLISLVVIWLLLRRKKVINID